MKVGIIKKKKDIYMLTIFNITEVLVVLVPVLMTVAFVTIAERKVMAAMQRRCGPNAVGPWGVLQPFADALKLLVKEIIRPRHSNSMLFVLGPCITLTFALLGWAIIPFGEGLAIFDYELGVFFALAVSSLGGYGILISGWAANSKYAFIGAIRATAQLLSYELVFSSIVLILILFSGSFSLTFIVECQQAVWNIFPLMPIALMFFIAILAETNRPPFDLAEAESELVAGLCEMRFIFSLWSTVTLFWVLELILYKILNLFLKIGNLSDLYRNFIKYVNNIINSYNDCLGYKISYFIWIIWLYNKFYTWTSKIMDPSERYTPCIATVLTVDSLFLKKSGSSIFKYHFDKYSNDIKGEKNKTIARSNKWKFIISEKSRKQIILGCKGNTFLDKINNYFEEWNNYYIIRICNTSKIIAEFHSLSIEGECSKVLHGKDLPNLIKEFISYDEKKNNFYKNISYYVNIKWDIQIDRLTELYSFFQKQYIILDNFAYPNKKKENLKLYRIIKGVKVNKLVQSKNKLHISSNITQNYFYCRNKKVYVGWVSIIRINGFSAQPTYYNNLIKRYHKEWKEILFKWIIKSNNNLKCNSITKINSFLNNYSIISFKDILMNERINKKRIPWLFKIYENWENFVKNKKFVLKKFR